jgi:hypothetical protein
MRNLLVSIFLSLFLNACGESEFDKAQSEASKPLEWLNDANPLADFESAIAQSDFRFIGLYGAGAYVPNVKMACLDYDNDIKFIDGSSDALMGYKHAKLNAIAQVYAGNYNTRMLIYLEKHKGFECAL